MSWFPCTLPPGCHYSSNPLRVHFSCRASTGSAFWRLINKTTHITLRKRLSVKSAFAYPLTPDLLWTVDSTETLCLTVKYLTKIWTEAPVATYFGKAWSDLWGPTRALMSAIRSFSAHVKLDATVNSRNFSKVPEGFELHYSKILEQTRTILFDDSADIALRHLNACLVFPLWGLIESHPRRIELLASDGTLSYMIKLYSDPQCYKDSSHYVFQFFQGTMTPTLADILVCSLDHNAKLAVLVLESVVSEDIVLGLSLFSRTANTIETSSKLDLLSSLPAPFSS